MTVSHFSDQYWKYINIELYKKSYCSVVLMPIYPSLKEGGLAIFKTHFRGDDETHLCHGQPVSLRVNELVMRDVRAPLD